jgi:two-component system chemotaxis response regulator CheB
MIRLLIADDSPTVRFLLKKMFSGESDIEVVAVAKNGEEAVYYAKQFRPDLITLDIRMPVMNGFEATKEIMENFPCPILVISASVNNDDLNIAFHAIKYGALDIVEKPKNDFQYESMKKKIIQKVKALAEVKVFHHRYKKKTKPLKFERSHFYFPKTVHLIGIATSTGGPQALQKIFKEIPKTFPIPIVVIQHISEGFGQGFSEWLNSESELHVQTAKNGTMMTPGNIYIAPDNKHLEIDIGGLLRVVDDDGTHRFIPSANVFFSSVAKFLHENAIGMILTGMGNDGVNGLKLMQQKGARTIAQDESSSLIYGMPKEAKAQGAADEVMNLDQIIDFLKSFV